MNKISFPSAPVGEWTPLRTNNPLGLFAYRVSQAESLMHFPDYGEGDLTFAQRREALDRCIVMHKPMTAIIIFLSIVSLEDLIRNIGINLNHIDGLTTYFPNISILNSVAKTPNPDKPSKQLDEDPFSILDCRKLNSKYNEAIGIEPVPQNEYAKLYDLSIIRHTVAHNGSIIRRIDIARFQYYEVIPNQIINPPIDFVNEIRQYVYNTGKVFLEKIQKRIFNAILSSISIQEFRKRPKLIVELIELFDYFGRMPTGNLPLPKNETEASVNDTIITEELLISSLNILEKEYY